MAEVPDPRIGTVLDERYRLVARLGVGGMGSVYSAVTVVDGTTVAIKVLHESFAAMTDFVLRFEREAAAMARMDHPNLIRVVGSGLSGATPYLVLEYLQGRSLEQELLQSLPSASRAVDIVRQVLAGMEAAHQNGVVHRDLKPENVLLLDGRLGDAVKVFDFGLAKIAGGDEPSMKLTMTGTTMGTPIYMSPEQAYGSSVDSRADLYSIGVILYELLVGRPPFAAESMLAVLRKHIDEPPPSPRIGAPHLSEALEQVVLRSLEKSPERRWQTAMEFGAALAATPEGRETTGVPAPPDPAAAPKRLPETRPQRSASSANVTAIARRRPPLRSPAGDGVGDVKEVDEVDQLPEETTHQVRPARVRKRGRGRFVGMLILVLLAGGAAWAWFDPTIHTEVEARVRRLVSSFQDSPPPVNPATTTTTTTEKKGRTARGAKKAAKTPASSH